MKTVPGTGGVARHRGKGERKANHLRKLGKKTKQSVILWQISLQKEEGPNEASGYLRIDSAKCILETDVTWRVMGIIEGNNKKC